MSVFLKLKERNITEFKLLSVLMGLYILPLIIANVYFNDDIKRSIYGGGWAHTGRVGAQYVMTFLNFGKIQNDMSPWGLLLGSIILCYTLVLFFKNNRIDIPLIIKIPTLFFCILNPFLLESLSYKYDSFFMISTLSLLFGAFSFPDCAPKKRLLVMFLFSFIALSFYQAILGAFIGMILITMIMRVDRGEKYSTIIKNAIVELVVIFIAFVLYMGIEHVFTRQSNYADRSSILIDFASHDGLSHLLSNMESFMRLTGLFMKSVPVIMTICLAVIIVISLVGTIKRIVESHHDALFLKIVMSVLTLLAPIMIFFIAILPLSVFENPVVHPRVLIGLSALCFFIGYLISSAFKNHYISCVALVVCLLFSFNYMYSYGNLLTREHDYSNYLAYSLAKDINGMPDSQDINTISFSGMPPTSREYQLDVDKYPLFKQLVTIYFGDDGWGSLILDHYTVNILQHRDITPEEVTAAERNKGSLITQNTIYSLYKLSNNTILLDYERPNIQSLAH